jgi:hypothetical protein
VDYESFGQASSFRVWFGCQSGLLIKKDVYLTRREIACNLAPVSGAIWCWPISRNPASEAQF